MNKPDKKKYLLQMADLVSMGWAMVLSIALGLIVGVYLDKKLETEPLCTLLFLFIGILAGFRIMYKTYKRFFKEDDSNDSGNP